MPKQYKIPLVAFTIQPRDTKTTMVRSGPVYEGPLLEAAWGDNAEIKHGPLPTVYPAGHICAGEKIPEAQRVIVATREDEEARLSREFAKDRVTKAPIFSVIYGFGRFAKAFAEAVVPEPGESKAKNVVPAEAVTEHETPESAAEAAGENPADEAPADEAKALEEIGGVGPELAQDLLAAGFGSVDQIAVIAPKTLEQIKGIGPASAKNIVESAKAIVEGLG